MPPFSILDLAPITLGSNAALAFRNTLDLAQHAERWGYHRYWLAEHHNMPGIASAATAVVIGHVAAGTSTIRVGAGGIMLPNHSPLVIAEQFGTLESLFPKRIDLGLGRAPGSDQITAMRPQAQPQRRHVSAGCSGAHRVVSRAGARTTRQGRTRRRAARAHLDSRLQPVRRDARRRARSALRLRLALRAGADDVGDRDLSQRVSSRRRSRRTASSVRT